MTWWDFRQLCLKLKYYRNDMWIKDKFNLTLIIDVISPSNTEHSASRIFSLNEMTCGSSNNSVIFQIIIIIF